MTVVLEPVMLDDTTIWPAIASLTSCLCQELARSGLPPVCICAPMPGDAIATDYVNEESGMAWVRLESGWPSTSFPTPSGAASCLAPLAFGVELGVAYCAPLGGHDGEPPDLVAQYESTRLQMAAMAAMRRAIVCCFPSGNAKDVALGVYQPVGPDGGVVGGTWSISVAQGVG